MMTPEQYAAALYTYRMMYPSSSVSGGRTGLHNKAIGGEPDSAHLYQLADDLVYDNPATYHNDRRYSDAARLGLEIVYEQVPLHDHVQPRGWKEWISTQPQPQRGA